MKQTYWTELDAEHIEIVEKNIGEYTGKILSIRVRHPLLKRMLWFRKSLKGNWYWRNTGRENDGAVGYIIVGEPLQPN